MFFIIGVTFGRIDDLGFVKTMLCKNCNQFGRMEAFTTYNCISFFFAPIIKFSKRYYIKTSCCGSVYEIDKDLGKAIARGDAVDISADDLRPASAESVREQYGCPNCGSLIKADFEYCPKCGVRLKNR